MKFQTSLIKGKLIKRYKRFLADVMLEDGTIVTAHCPNSGSMLSVNESGAEVQTRVLYVGLSRAYFVDKTGAFCGVGTSSSSGWEWTIQPELGVAIQKVIGVYENSEPATFVSLPVTVK